MAWSTPSEESVDPEGEEDPGGEDEPVGSEPSEPVVELEVEEPVVGGSVSLASSEVSFSCAEVRVDWVFSTVEVRDEVSRLANT